MRISYSLCTQIQAKRNIWTTEKRYRRDYTETLQREESGNNRGRGVSGSYPYAGKCAAVYKYSTVHGISQGKKHVDDIRQACELKIQVREQKFLVPRVLCRYGRAK